MHGSQRISEEIGLLTELRRRGYAIQQRQAHMREAVQEDLQRWDRDAAQRHFELLLQWNELHELVAQCHESLGKEGLPTYVVDGWFAQDLIQHLTPGRDEEITHVTGPRAGSFRVLSRLCRLTTETKSMVYARGSARSCADAEIEILEHGNLLHAAAHSHPGKGAAASQPSSIDTNYLGKIQRAGSEAIGIIVTRDGWVRFFSVIKPFRVFVMGTGVVQTEEYVFHVTPTNPDSDQGGCQS